MCGLSHVRLFATVARQAPLSMENSPGKSTGAGCHFIFQGIFPIQGSNLHLLHCQVDSFPLSHLGTLFVKLAHLISLGFGLLAVKKIRLGDV